MDRHFSKDSFNAEAGPSAQALVKISRKIERLLQQVQSLNIHPIKENSSLLAHHAQRIPVSCKYQARFYELDGGWDDDDLLIQVADIPPHSFFHAGIHDEYPAQRIIGVYDLKSSYNEAEPAEKWVMQNSFTPEAPILLHAPGAAFVNTLEALDNLDAKTLFSDLKIHLDEKIEKPA